MKSRYLQRQSHKQEIKNSSGVVVHSRGYLNRSMEPATTIRCCFEQHASTIIGSMMRSPGEVAREGVMMSPSHSDRLAKERRLANAAPKRQNEISRQVAATYRSPCSSVPVVERARSHTKKDGNAKLAENPTCEGLQDWIHVPNPNSVGRLASAPH